MDSPALPPEIWRTIFRFATEIEGILDFSPLPPLSNERRPHFEFPSAESHQYEMATKRAVVRVCRLWWNLAIEYLYEFVWLWYPRELLSLVNALKLHSHVETALGWHVKCVWLSIGITWSNSEAVDDALRLLFNLCHDIKAIRIWPDSTFDMGFPIIADRAPSIRMVEMEWNHRPQSRSFCLPLLLQLHEFERLEALEISFFLGTYQFPHVPMTFPRLRALRIRCDSEESSDIILGNVTQWNIPLLCFLLLELLSRSAAIMESFLHAHGRNIHTFEFGAGFVIRFLPLIGKHAPSLQDIAVDGGRMDSPAVAPLAAPRLRRVRVSGILVRNESSAFIDAVDRILLANAPSLKCIQFTDVTASKFSLPAPPAVEEGPDRWMEWSENLQRRGIRIEDKFGISLEPSTNF
jgi:hypothetical protein